MANQNKTTLERAAAIARMLQYGYHFEGMLPDHQVEIYELNKKYMYQQVGIVANAKNWAQRIDLRSLSEAEIAQFIHQAVDKLNFRLHDKDKHALINDNHIDMQKLTTALLVAGYQPSLAMLKNIVGELDTVTTAIKDNPKLFGTEPNHQVGPQKLVDALTDLAQANQEFQQLYQITQQVKANHGDQTRVTPAELGRTIDQAMQAKTFGRAPADPQVSFAPEPPAAAPATKKGKGNIRKVGAGMLLGAALMAAPFGKKQTKSTPLTQQKVEPTTTVAWQAEDTMSPTATPTTTIDDVDYQWAAEHDFVTGSDEIGQTPWEKEPAPTTDVEYRNIEAVSTPDLVTSDQFFPEIDSARFEHEVSQYAKPNDYSLSELQRNRDSIVQEIATHKDDYTPEYLRWCEACLQACDEVIMTNQNAAPDAIIVNESEIYRRADAILSQEQEMVDNHVETIETQYQQPAPDFERV